MRKIQIFLLIAFLIVVISSGKEKKKEKDKNNLKIQKFNDNSSKENKNDDKENEKSEKIEEKNKTKDNEKNNQEKSKESITKNEKENEEKNEEKGKNTEEKDKDKKESKTEENSTVKEDVKEDKQKIKKEEKKEGKEHEEEEKDNKKDKKDENEKKEDKIHEKKDKKHEGQEKKENKKDKKENEEKQHKKEEKDNKKDKKDENEKKEDKIHEKKDKKHKEQEKKENKKDKKENEDKHHEEEEKDNKKDKKDKEEEKEDKKHKKEDKKEKKNKNKKEEEKKKEKPSKKELKESIINISDYKYPTPDDSTYDYIAIMSTNDIHGAYYPQYINGSTSYSYGGVEYLGKYISIMREEWGDKFMWLDGGDIFQGGLESALSKGDIMTDFMNKMQCNASTIGNHEWDYGQDFLIRQMARSQFPYIVDNILNTTSNKTLFLPNQVITKIFDFGKIKIGVIGITTVTTPQTTFGDLHGIKFLDYSDIIIREAKELRKKTNSVILLSHAGMKCLKDGDSKLKLQIWTKNSKQKECNPEDEIYILLNALPEHTVDAVVAAHKHDVTHHWINGTPVFSSLNNAVYSQIMYLPFDKKSGKLIRDEIKMESPLPVCEKVFEKTRRCTPMNPKDVKKLGKLSKFSFHGTVIEKEPLLKNISETYWPKYNNFVSSIITKSNDVLQMNKNSENSLGNLYCDIMRRATGADVSILNSGAFRNTWNPGQISLANIFGMSPFETRIVTVEMTGEELLKMLEQTQGGKYGFYPTSGLKLLVSLEPKKKLYYAKLFDGLYEYPIENNKTYTVATTDFDIPYGGDDFADVMKWYKPRNLKYYDVVRNTIIDYLKRVATIKDKQFVRSSLPRMRIVNKVDLSVPPSDITSIDQILGKNNKEKKNEKKK